MDITKLVVTSMAERLRWTSVDIIGKDCGYSNSTLHRAIKRVATEPYNSNKDIFPLFLFAAFLGMKIKGFNIDIQTTPKQVLIRKGANRGQYEAIPFPTAATINGTAISTGVELLNYFAGIEQPA